MLSNYFKIALRNLKKHKGYSFINIAGLALGLACCVLILFFVQDELSYDRFHNHADRLYRVAFNGYAPNSPPDRFAATSRPMGRVLRQQYPDEIEQLVRIVGRSGTVIKHEGTYFYGDTFWYVEPEFLTMFTFPLLQGNAETALNRPNTLVMTQAMERKYFGEQSALGQSITLDDTLTFTVTGVMADLPHNSHFTTDFLVSYETLLTLRPENEDWLALNGYTYLMLREGVSVEAFEAKMTDLVARNFGEVLDNIGLRTELVLQPLRDIYLHSDRGGEIGLTGDISYIYIFSAIALFVLLIACINFMNLSTARSMERAKEVGVRKVVGSSRGMLIQQFLSESVLMCVLALGIAIGMVAVALPFFNDLAGKEISLSTLATPVYVLGLLGTVLLLGLLSGSYPAFLLSSFQSIDVLKGQFRSSRRGVLLRRGLVVSQFAISVGLIASTMLVFEQLDFMRNQDLGFEKEKVLVIDAQGVQGSVLAQQYETARAEFARLPAVAQVSASMHVPGRALWVQLFTAEGLQQNESRRAQVVIIDEHYLETYQIDLIAGRGYAKDFETDETQAIVINEMAVGYIGWNSPEEAVGKTINLGGGMLGGEDRTVIGVVRDYHHHSLKQVLEPMILLNIPQMFSFFSLRLTDDDLPATLAAVEQTWQALFPGYTFESFFLDADFDRLYRTEQRMMNIFGVFSVLAILIACLGLFGLAAFTAQQRTKEIGVRKVLGASVPGIVLLLSKEFTGLVLVGVVLAVPAAFFAMDLWLDTFAYRMDISWWSFLLAGVLALTIAWLTVGYQSIRAALTNPVHALRYE